jgi:EAL domain-containing protein (putative c-di-GMP-specific phosphodiesterase class I)
MPEMVYSQLFVAGETIFRLGDRGRNAYFIESGQVEVTVEREGETLIIARLGQGEVFGEMSMVDDAPRSATITALEDTEVIVIQRSRFMRPLAAADPMMNLLLRVVLTRFRDAQSQLSGLKALPGDHDPSLEEIRKLAFDRISSERELRRGLERAEFELHYQPIVALDGGHIAGFEALTRWRRDGADFQSPGGFIPLAEETGLIVELGRWALASGLREYGPMADAFARTHPGLPLPFMSINVSGLQLDDSNELAALERIIVDSDVDPAVIKLEITETLMVENPDQAATALHQLKALGVSVAMDDFGTGFSSLGYLHQFPLDTLKIDQIFVANMQRSESSLRIVHSIVRLAEALELDMVAEGIEDQARLAALRDMGCQYGQGFFMSRPLNAADTLSLIESSPRWT